MDPTVVRVTSVWTERHSAVALVLVVAVCAGMVTGAESGAYRIVGGAVVLIVIFAALRMDALSGIVLGLAGAALLVGAKQLTGGWTPDAFVVSLMMSLALIVLGWVTALAGGRLRERPSRDLAASMAVSPAYGSLGLIHSHVALARLDDEIARARRHRRPLTVVLLETQITAEGLSVETRRAAHRAVARLVESLVRDTDVPFALAENEVGAILPETDTETAWGLAGPLVDAITGASFTVREKDERRRLADCADLHLGVVSLGRHHPTSADSGVQAEELLAEARAAAHLHEQFGDDQADWGAMEGRR